LADKSRTLPAVGGPCPKQIVEEGSSDTGFEEFFPFSGAGIIREGLSHQKFKITQ